MSGQSTPRVVVENRVMAIDVLRGFDMIWILGAESCVRALAERHPWGVFAFLGEQMHHVEWDGFRFYDFIFPLFLFLMGVSMVYSLDRRLSRGSRGAVYAHVAVRSILLYLLGIVYYGGIGTFFQKDVLWGVLNRFGLCYFAAGFLYCFFRSRPRVLLAICIGVLLAYWVLLCFVPVPETGQVSLSETSNWVRFVDEQLPPYYGFSSEGFLSTFPAIAGCLAGALAGLYLKNSDHAAERKALVFVGTGIALVLVGLLWSRHFPLNKNLWSSSFVLVTTGYSCLLLGLFYWVVDIRRWRWWTPMFLWIGMNAITLYMAPRFIDFGKAASCFAGGVVAEAAGTYGPLLQRVVALLLVVLLARFLYRRGIFLRV